MGADGSPADEAALDAFLHRNRHAVRAELWGTTVATEAALERLKQAVGAEPRNGNCGRCYMMPAQPGEAWCEHCLGESSYSAYVGGVHVSQLDPSEVRSYGCVCPAPGRHADSCPVMSA